MSNTYTTAAKDLMLAALPGSQWITLHSDDPSDTGINQVAGTTRKPITLAAASGGARVSSDVVEFDLLNGQTVTHVGFWDAANGGNFLGYAVITPAISLTQDGPVRIADIECDLNLVCSG